MGHMRGSLLAVVITAIYYEMAVVTGLKVLDMAPDAVDDQYDGCRDQVLEKVKSGLLEEELLSSERFKAAWNANKKCTTLIPGGVREHTTAILAYQNGANDFRTEFNAAVESLGGNSTVYDSEFQFKSLHFLLMDSMKLLNKGDCQNKTVYLLADKGKYKVQPDTEIRFGMFLEVVPDTDSLEELDDQVLFSITSCLILNLKDTKCDQGNWELEMLLSPVEVFKVEAVKEIKKDDEAYTNIILKHSSYSSNNNCYLFPGTGSPDASTAKADPSTLAGISTQCLGSVVMVLMSVSLLLFAC